MAIGLDGPHRHLQLLKRLAHVEAAARLEEARALVTRALEELALQPRRNLGRRARRKEPARQHLLDRGTEVAPVEREHLVDAGSACSMFFSVSTTTTSTVRDRRCAARTAYAADIE